MCAESLRGLLFGHPVLLVTTGIGHDRAALCLSGILDYYGPYVKEIMFIGTGGFSPAAGGILNSDNCDEPTPAKDVEVGGPRTTHHAPRTTRHSSLAARRSPLTAHCS